MIKHKQKGTGGGVSTHRSEDKKIKRLQEHLLGRFADSDVLTDRTNKYFKIEGFKNGMLINGFFLTSETETQLQNTTEDWIRNHPIKRTKFTLNRSQDEDEDEDLSGGGLKGVKDYLFLPKRFKNTGDPAINLFLNHVLHERKKDDDIFTIPLSDPDYTNKKGAKQLYYNYLNATTHKQNQVVPAPESFNRWFIF